MENIRFFELIKLARNVIVDIERPRNSIIYVLTGSVGINNSPKERAELHKGFQFLLPQRIIAQFQTREEAILLICQFDILKHFTQNEIKQLVENSELSSHSILNAPIHLQTFWSLIHLYIESNIDMSEMSQLIEKQLFILLKKSYSLNEQGTFLAPVLGQDLQFAQFVMENCLNVKSVGELAKRANYSTSGFIKKFQRCFNCPPYSWINEFKIKRIMQDINYTQIPFGEIADKYGFGSYSYFYTFCKKYYNSGPLELRRGTKHFRR